LSGYLLYSDSNVLRIRAGFSNSASFTVALPANSSELSAFREMVEPFDRIRRDPLEMDSWLEAIAGPEIELAGVSVKAIEPSADGEQVSFLLSVQEGVTKSGDLTLAVFDGLTP